MLSIASLAALSANASSLLGGAATNEPQTLAVAAAAVVAVLTAAAWLAASPPTTKLLTKDGKPIKPRHVPRPAGTLPVLGNAHQVMPNQYRYHSWLLEQCRAFNFQPWRMKIPGQANLYILSDSAQFEEVMTTQFDHFPKGNYQLEMLGTFFGKSVVASDGERWYHQRKTAVKFFSARSLRAYMATSARRNLVHVMELIETNQLAGSEVNLTNLFLDFTMQTFVETGLGVNLDWIGRDEPHPFQHAIDVASVLVAKRFLQPGWLWRLQRAMNVGDEARLAKHMKTVVGWLTEVVDQSLAAGVSKKERSQRPGAEEIKSMIELFAEQSREDADGLRAEDLVDFIQVMVIAARDTTAAALTWFFYELSKNPHVEAKVRAELMALFPDRAGKKDNYFSADEARSLVYLEAALKEALRLHPPGPFLFKEVAEDSVISGDILLHKGDLVGIAIYSEARNPNVWGPDAAQFNPDRWIDAATGELKQFSTSNLGMLELRVVSANLLSRFRFELDENLDDSYTTAALLVMKTPLIAKVHAPPPPTAEAA